VARTKSPSAGNAPKQPASKPVLKTPFITMPTATWSWTIPGAPPARTQCVEACATEALTIQVVPVKKTKKAAVT
jgi:hypothetical protein